MNKAVLLIMLAALPLLIGTSHAYTYSNININASITQNSSLFSIYTVDYSITYYNNSNSINISLPSGSYGFSVLSPNNISFKEFYSCQIFASNSGCETYQLSGVSNGEKIRILYYYKEHFNSNNQTFDSEFGFIPPTYVDSASIYITLPSGSLIPVNVSYPLTPQIIVSNGKTSLYWRLYNVTYYVYNGMYPEFTFGFKYQKAISAPYSLPSYAYFIIVIAILAAAYLVFRMRRGRKRPLTAKARRHNPLIDVLSTEEKKLLGLLSRKDFVTQKEVVEKSGFSKAKVSKIVSKLLKYKLIKIRPDGKFNKIKRT